MILGRAAMLRGLFGALNVLNSRAVARGLCGKVQPEWGYRHMNQFQEIVGGFGLNSRDCDRIASTLVAKDFRGMFKRLEKNLNFAKGQGLGREHTKSLLLRNVNVFTGRPNVFEQRWQQLASEFDLSGKQMSELIVGFPVIMEVSYTSKIKPLMELFQEWGVPFSGFRQVLLKYPKLLRLSIDAKIVPLHWMFMEAGFKPEQFGAMVVKEPKLLTEPPMEIRTRLKEISGIGLPRDVYVSVLVSNPMLVKYSLIKRIEWFEALLGVQDGRDAMGALMVKDPSVFMGSLDLLGKKVKALKFYGIFKPEQRVLLSANPLVLAVPELDLKRKLKLARVRMRKLPMDIVKCPEYLTAPLELINSRVALVEGQHVAVEGVSLKSLIIDDDEAFAKETGMDSKGRSRSQGSKQDILKALRVEDLKFFLHATSTDSG